MGSNPTLSATPFIYLHLQRVVSIMVSGFEPRAPEFLGLQRPPDMSKRGNGLNWQQPSGTEEGLIMLRPWRTT